MAASPAQSSVLSQHQLFMLVRGHLLERLRLVFDLCESQLLASGESPFLCCDLRRSRRSFMDNFLSHLQLRCEEPGRSWFIGSSAGVRHARTLIHLAAADSSVRSLCEQQAAAFGRLAAAWNQQTGLTTGVLDCPLSPHTITRLFFLLLPDLPVPLRIRCRLGHVFCDQLPATAELLCQTVTNMLQRRGVLVAAMQPLALPEWWQPLEKPRQPSVAAQALVVPPRLVDRASALATDLSMLAQSGQMGRLVDILAGERQTLLLPWLLRQLDPASSDLPPTGREILGLLAGPLLKAACEQGFADAMHPARRVVEELLRWAPGWEDRLGLEGFVPEYCREKALALARGDNGGWADLLDYLLQLGKRVQQDSSAVVASTRLSLQVTEVRAEVDNLLAERAGLEYWPQVVIDILHESWAALLMAIHWQEGKASDAWLHAIAVADELLASVQPGVDRQMRQRLIQRVTQLLQSLRRGFEKVGVERKHYAVLLQRLEKVHLALLQGVEPDALPEPAALWPPVAPLPARDEPFEVGHWLRREDGSVFSVQFSDPWCTVLLDTHNACLESCSTAALQAAFYDGNLVLLPSPRPLLSAT